MLKGNDIVYVSNDWKTENKTSSHQIAERLAKGGNRILYVEAAGLRKPRATKRDFIKIIKKLLMALRSPRNVAKDIYVYSPLVIPFHKIYFFRKLNQIISTWSVKRACKKIGMKNPLLWIVLPHFYYLVGKLKEKGVVYYCVDEYSTLPNADASAIKTFETNLIKKANVVFAVSTELVKNKKLLNNNTFYSPHGVDIKHFKKALDMSIPIPQEISRIAKPIIGFFGLIEHWVDLDLIKYIANEKPDWSLLFIGKSARDLSQLNQFKNIYLLGWKDYKSLPAYLKTFDVAIIPFKVNELIINSNPLKMKEYMAGGKPVVTINIPAVEGYENLLYIAEGQRDFVEQINRALNEDSPDRIFQRVAAMELESWDARVEWIGKTVIEHIPTLSNNYKQHLDLPLI
jgi:glycosyltransferase involved in cell wall biosynthesis